MLDSLDQKLMQQLHNDGRQSNVDLAKMLGVAESTIRNRIKKLVNSGIMKIVAVPDPLKLGYGCISIVGLQVKLSDLKQVAEKLAQSPTVFFVASTTGRFDLIMILLLHTPQELSDFMNKEVFTSPGVLRSETFICVEITKNPWVETMGIIESLANSETMD